MSTKPQAPPSAVNSRRVYVDGPRGVRVPFREVTPHSTRDRFGRAEENETVRLYDASGPWGDPIAMVAEMNCAPEAPSQSPATLAAGVSVAESPARPRVRR